MQVDELFSCRCLLIGCESGAECEGSAVRVLLECSVEKASIDHDFVVHVTENVVTAVEFEYSNTSLHSKVLRISTDRPDLLDFDNSDTLVSLNGGATLLLNVTVRPLACKRHRRPLVALVYINDERDKTLQCNAFHINVTS